MGKRGMRHHDEKQRSLRKHKGNSTSSSISLPLCVERSQAAQQVAAEASGAAGLAARKQEELAKSEKLSAQREAQEASQRGEALNRELLRQHAEHQRELQAPRARTAGFEAFRELLGLIWSKSWLHGLVQSARS